MSPGIEGSRSGGLLAATWASMVQLGREGYRRYAEQIFETADAMQEAVRSHPELRIMGDPDVPVQLHERRVRHLPRQRLHAARGWRFNGQQYPNAMHMAVTRPQTQPGVVEAFAADLAEAVPYAGRSTGGRGAVHGAPSTAAWPAG